MDALTAFGLLAVVAILVCYALEDRSPCFISAFACSCSLGSAYGFLQGAWPFGLSNKYGRWLLCGVGMSIGHELTDSTDYRGRQVGVSPAWIGGHGTDP